MLDILYKASMVFLIAIVLFGIVLFTVFFIGIMMMLIEEWKEERSKKNE